MTTGAIALLPACSLMTGSGPSTGAVNRAADRPLASANIQIIDMTDAVARRVIASSEASLFSETLGDATPVGALVGPGDVLDIAVWEAPPAALFGSMGGDSRAVSSSISVARNTSLPEQMVNSEGRISIPFVGGVQAAGRTPQQIEREIVARLAGKAHLPQVVVRVVRNATANVTIVGDVVSSARVPLTSKGERLLDIVAAAGGVRQPVGKMTVQITRGTSVTALPLETVIRDPRQNIRLKPDDVVTVLFQPFSFTALGAVGTNAELPFEGTGITLAQAIGRIGGLQDFRADARGVFVFRLEEPAALDPERLVNVKMTPDGKIPVIYRVDMKDPASFFIVQSFPIRNKDVLYVSNAPLADIQKFVNIVSSFVFPILSVQNAAQN